MTLSKKFRTLLVAVAAILFASLLGTDGAAQTASVAAVRFCRSQWRP
jgi:hypothetical protein